ncbi:MAG: hypothetical protein HY921_13130 [Elusimicrobia bacterium]|nr:hypothetical protein [Elusimicrobiota bacterium]
MIKFICFSLSLALSASASAGVLRSRHPLVKLIEAHTPLQESVGRVMEVAPALTRLSPEEARKALELMATTARLDLLGLKNAHTASAVLGTKAALALMANADEVLPDLADGPVQALRQVSAFLSGNQALMDDFKKMAEARGLTHPGTQGFEDLGKSARLLFENMSPRTLIGPEKAPADASFFFQFQRLLLSAYQGSLASQPHGRPVDPVLVDFSPVYVHPGDQEGVNAMPYLWLNGIRALAAPGTSLRVRHQESFHGGESVKGYYSPKLLTQAGGNGGEVFFTLFTEPVLHAINVIMGIPLGTENQTPEPYPRLP